MSEPDMKELRQTVALYMRPWLVPEYSASGYVKRWTVPPWSQVLEAADGLIAGLKKEGFRIVGQQLPEK